jgi:hypothetical protein
MRPSGVLHHLQFSHCWEKVCDWRDVSIRRWALPSAHQRVLPPPPPELMAPRRGCSSYISRPPETGSSLGPRLPTGRCPAYLQDVPLSATWGRAEWPGKGPTDNSEVLRVINQTCKQIESDIQTEKDRHFRHSNQQRKILGLANTNPDMQTNRIRHTNRERKTL